MDLSYVKRKATTMLVNNGDDWEAFTAAARGLVHEVLNVR